MNDNLQIADDDLKCPITMDWLENPITLPCCGKSVSKLPLIQFCETSHRQKCPLCNADLTNFDILNAPISRNLASMIEIISKSGIELTDSANLFVSKTDSETNPYYGKIDYLCPNSIINSKSPNQTIIGKLKICSKKRSEFKTLLIPVIDKSGSMGGNPIKQCIYSLGRIVDLTYDNTNLKTTIITYSDTANTIQINTSQQIELSKAVVNNIQAGGGTSFKAAFTKIVEVCENQIDSLTTSVVIIFLTDGEDSSIQKSQRKSLVDDLQIKLNTTIPIHVQTQIHSIGFGSSHDFDFLDSLKNIGKSEGAYRYADPNEDTDSLSNKINSVLNVIRTQTTIPIHISKIDVPILFSDQSTNTYWLDLTKWIPSETIDIDIFLDMNLTNSAEQSESNVFNIKCTFNEDQNSPTIWLEWLSHLTDVAMGEVLDLSQIANSNLSINDQIHLELLVQRSKAIKVRVKSLGNLSQLTDLNAQTNLLERLDKIISTVQLLNSGQKIDAQTKLKLSDMKHEGKFATNFTGTTRQNTSIKSGGTDILPHSNILKSRSNIFCSWETFPKIQRLRCQTEIKYIAYNKTDKIIDFYKSRPDLHSYISDDGLDIFGIACSIGKYGFVEYLLETDLNIRSNINKIYQQKQDNKIFNFTPLGLAIVGSYWKTAEILVKYGGKILINGEKLFRTCVSKHYWKTGELMIKSNFIQVTDQMIEHAPSPTALIWLSKVQGLESIDIYKAIPKLMVDVIRDQISDIKETISWSDYLYLFDKPNIEKIQIVDLLLSNSKARTDEVINIISGSGSGSGSGTETNPEPEVTTILYICCEKGYTEMFRTIVQHIQQEDLMAHINWSSPSQGNSCLWIAAANKHIDILTELLGMGADPNLTNLKGDTALIPVCQKNAESVVELLLAAGIDINKFNPQRENPVLVCCRSGQHKQLDLILNHIKINLGSDSLNYFLNFYAEIDGFNPILASVELDHVECLKVIYKYDQNLEYRSAITNKIIRGATPLHLATFYNRLGSVIELIKLGANINAQTEPEAYNILHLAIKHGHLDMVRYIFSMDPAIVTKLLAMPNVNGKLPAFYANLAGNEQILSEFFTNKLGLVFSNLFITDSESEKLCADILVKYGRSVGVYEYDNICNMDLGNGSSPLEYAILTGKDYLINKLIEMGSDPLKTDHRGISPAFWFSYLNKQQYLLNHVDFNSNTESDLNQINKQLSNINSAKLLGPQNAMLLNYTPDLIKLSILDDYENNFPNKNLLKMLDGFGQILPEQTLALISRPNPNLSLIGFVDKLKTNKLGFQQSDSATSVEYFKYMLLDAKINLIKIVASGETNLTPNQILAIYLYTANLELFRHINQNLAKITVGSVWYPFVSILYHGIKRIQPIPPQTEIYRGVDQLFNPEIYAIGSEIRWDSFSIANTNWKHVMDLIDRKRGIIFVIKSQTGRAIKQFSKFPETDEIVFLPGSKFKVTNYYMADQICLAQANIRNTTFGITNSSNKNGAAYLEKATNGQTSIIIELEEMI